MAVHTSVFPTRFASKLGRYAKKFVQDHIAAGISFATETTFRSAIAFDQMKLAHEVGFSVSFTYICVGDLGTSVTRVKQRAFMGGHSASEETVQDIRAKSLSNLRRAFAEAGTTIDAFDLYDNSAFETTPKLIASFLGREITFLETELPAWMDEALGQTPYSTVNLRQCFEHGKDFPVAD